MTTSNIIPASASGLSVGNMDVNSTSVSVVKMDESSGERGVGGAQHSGASFGGDERARNNTIGAPTSLSSSQPRQAVESEKKTDGVAESIPPTAATADTNTDKDDTGVATASTCIKGDDEKTLPCIIPAQSKKECVRPAEGTAGESQSQSQSQSQPHNNNSGIRFVIATNDNTPRNLVWLVNLKAVFAKQLPKMPEVYIAKLVMDRNHRSLVCLDKDGQVNGGICFRPYLDQRFAEIAFCAVKSTQQVKGFGTIMMNELKEYVKTLGLTHFLTYADNFAVGYFKKQGFSDNLTIQDYRWKGYIKDYDGGTLMECIINPAIDYRAVKETVKRHRAFLVGEIKKRLKVNRVYEGIKAKDLAKYASNPYAIPGVREAGWRATTSYKSGRVLRPFQSALLKCVSRLSACEFAWPFREPVPPTLEGYLDVVKYPVDLSLIKLRAVNGMYKTVSSFFMDLERMCDNCKMFNPEESIYWECADKMQRQMGQIVARDLGLFKDARNAMEIEPTVEDGSGDAS